MTSSRARAVAVRDLRVAIQAQFTPAGITLALRWTASAAAALIQGYRGPLLKDGSASQDTVQTNGTLRSIRVSPLDTKRFFRVFVGRNATEGRQRSDRQRPMPIWARDLMGAMQRPVNSYLMRALWIGDVQDV